MLWNPFQYQLNASYLSDEGNLALVEIRKGAGVERIHFPKSMLPPNLPVGSSFSIKLEDPETARTTEVQTMRQLLSDLIK